MYGIHFLPLGLFDKAKKKILGDRDNGDDAEQSSKASSSVTPQSTSLYDVDYWAPQEIGEVCRLILFLSKNIEVLPFIQ